MHRLQVYRFLEDEDDDIALLNGRLDSGKVADVLQSLVDPTALDAAFIVVPAR